MLLNTAEKRALRRLQADNFFTKKQLAEHIGISSKTVTNLTRNDEPQEVKNTVYKKIMSAISANY